MKIMVSVFQDMAAIIWSINVRNIQHIDALIFILNILYGRSFLHFACNTLILVYCNDYEESFLHFDYVICISWNLEGNCPTVLIICCRFG